jgi:Flp pilus assembly protein protease CpaA
MRYIYIALAQENVPTNIVFCMNFVSHVVLSLICLWICVDDVRHLRIANTALLALVVLSLMVLPPLQALGTMGGVVLLMLGFQRVWCVFSPSAGLSPGLGGGDVKLIGVLGACGWRFLGPLAFALPRGWLLGG